MNGPIEPGAEFRQIAGTLRQMYLALIQEEFTTQEALVIIGQIIATNTGSAT